jgi:hypothetical protein
LLLFWYRLENLGKEFPLLKEAYNETKLLYLSKKPSWYGSINIIVNNTAMLVVLYVHQE